MNVCRNTTNQPLFYNFFVKYLLDSNKICHVSNDMLEGSKVFDSSSIKLMRYYKDREGRYYWDVHGNSYNDKFVVNKDAPKGYILGRASFASTSSVFPLLLLQMHFPMF